MGWQNVLKNKDWLNRLARKFQDPKKGIGYVTIVHGQGYEDKIKELASSIGAQYKMFPSTGKTGLPNGNSFANGGHFVFFPSKIQPILSNTPFSSVDELVESIANESYLDKPYRRVIDKLFNTPNITLTCERGGQ
tara:strand:- start:2924 stop:3328 length:405 start_codon:yes stop_codon:yes gene_type:complete